MDFKFSTDLMHLFSDDEKDEMPEELLKFRDYLGHIIKAATVTDEIEFLSAIPCRKRVNRKKCDGFVKIMKQNLPESYIFWHCTSCEDGGRIANWKGSCYDHLQFPMSSKDAEIELKITVEITREEMNALLSGGLYDPDSERIIHSGRPSKTGVQLCALDGDMDNFLGYLASDANHEKAVKRRKHIDSVYSKVDLDMSLAYDV